MDLNSNSIQYECSNSIRFESLMNQIWGCRTGFIAPQILTTIIIVIIIIINSIINFYIF